MRFESSFNKTPLGEKINQHLMINCKDYENMHHYLRDFIFMKIYPDTESQLFVSMLNFNFLNGGAGAVNNTFPTFQSDFCRISVY